MARQSDRTAGRSKGSVVVFDRFAANFERRQLTADGEFVHLAPLTWRLFELLVDRAGEIVSKQELLTTLWPDTATTEYAMSRTIRRLREALGDDARKPRFLRTVHGVGFQWIAQGRTDPPPAMRRTVRHSDFIGRTAQIELLAGAAATAIRGRRQLIAIEGDLGVGKTSLVEEFIGADGEGWWVCRGRSIESRSDPEPYAPILEAIDRLASTAPEIVLPLMRTYAPTWLAQLPWLTTAPDRPTVEEALRISSRTRMLRELARLLEELAIVRPVLMFIDDVHWADSATVDALDAIATREERARLLVVVCLRPTDGAAPGGPLSVLLSELAAREAVRRIAVEPFGAGDVRELVGSLSGSESSSTDTATIADVLIRWTGGNALFATAALRHLGSRLGGMSEFALDQLPPTLSDLVNQAVASLDADDRHLLEVAALIGDRISASLVAEVVERDPVDVEERLTEIAHTTPILRSVTGAPDTDVGHGFAHAAYRQASMHRIGRLRAERAHRSIGEALERLPADAVEPREIARHLDLGGRPGRAVRHWLVAGRRSRRNFAHHDALAQYERAVSTLAALGEHRGEQEIEARLGLAISQLALGTNVDEETQENIEELQRLVEPLASVPDAFSIWQTTLLVNNLAGRTDRVRAMAPPLLQMAEHRHRPHELMDAHHAMGEAALHAADLAAARVQFDAADHVLRAIGEDSPKHSDGMKLWLRDSGARVKSARAGLAILQDRHEDAREALAASLRRSTHGPNTPLVRVGNLTICAAIHWLLQDIDRAVELADHALDQAAGENEDFAAIAATIRWASGVRCRPPEVRAAVRTMLDQPTVPFPLGLVVFMRSELLPPIEMLGVLDETEALCRRVDTHWTDVEWSRQRGRLLLLDGAEPGDAAIHLQRAIEIDRARPSPFFAAAARRDLSELDADSGGW